MRPKTLPIVTSMPVKRASVRTGTCPGDARMGTTIERNASTLLREAVIRFCFVSITTPRTSAWRRGEKSLFASFSLKPRRKISSLMILLWRAAFSYGWSPPVPSSRYQNMRMPCERQCFASGLVIFVKTYGAVLSSKGRCDRVFHTSVFSNVRKEQRKQSQTSSEIGAAHHS